MTDERREAERLFRAAVLAGDARAWQARYDALAPALERYVRWRCGGCPHLADDCLQDAWLTAVRSVSAFDPEAGDFAAWLRGVAANAVRNRLRSRRRREGRQRPLESEPASAPVERAVRVAEVLAELPPRYEEALRLKYLEGHAVLEIAAIWGESAKAVESCLTRARQAFREAFGEGEGE